MATTSTALQCCERSSTLQVKAIVGKQDAEPKLSQRQRKRTKSSTMAERVDTTAAAPANAEGFGGCRRDSNPRPSEPQVLGGRGSRRGRSEASVRTRMSWRSWLAVRLQGGRASGVAPTGVDSTDSSWIHARKDNAAPGVPSGDRSGRRGERGSRVLDIRYMLPGRGVRGPPLHFGVSYTASKLCGCIHALLEQITKTGFAPQCPCVCTEA